MRVLISCNPSLSITRAAILRARELGADWASISYMPIAEELKDTEEDNEIRYLIDDYNYLHHRVPRHDKILLQVFDELGSDISKDGVYLIEIPDDVEYYVESYVREWIAESHRTWDVDGLSGEMRLDSFTKDSIFSGEE